jgi:trk system potassium uptake protein TrkH
MVSVALVFLLGAFGAVPAFIQLGMPAIDALFEAMSGLTTTGLSTAHSPDDWPFAAHVLRAWLQWIGGLVMATAVLALLLPSGMPTRRLGQVGMSSGDRIASTRLQARQLLGVYLGLTIAMSLVTAIAIPDTRDAIVLTLSAISTGGFSPRSDSLASYSLAGQSLVMLSCVLGSISLVSYVLILKHKPYAAWKTGSFRRVALTLFLLCAVYSGLLLMVAQPPAADIPAHLLNLVSASTTAGFSNTASPTAGPAFVLFLVAMLIGADVGSTGGGLKAERISVLILAMRHALRGPAMPENAVAPLRQDGRPIKSKTLIGLLALLVIYAVCALVIWGHFVAHGYPVNSALFDTISALSTVGLSTGLVGPDLPVDLKLSLTFAMWLGRLEFIAVLVILLPATWTRRG